MNVVRRHSSAVLILISVLVICTPAQAQQPGKLVRIGYLDSSTGSTVLVDAFRQELNKLGWIEGKNIAIEYRFGESKGSAHIRELVADLVRLKVDLIVVSGTPTALAAKGSTSTIPIVMALVGDPVAAGLIASLAQPGGNVTGISSLAPELNTKALEILKDTVPKLTRVGYFRTAAAKLQPKELRPAALALKLKLEEIEAQADAKGLESAFQIAKQKELGAMMTHNNPSFFTARKRIVELASKYRLPAIYPQKDFVSEGGLMSYGVDLPDLYRRAAVYVDKILKGAQPADLPVQQATNFEFVVNLKAAKQIGLTIPPNVLARADRVIR